MYGTKKKMKDGGSAKQVAKKSKRKTVTYSTERPAPGTYGGTRSNTKTVTKRRGDKIITKTKTARKAANPMAGGTVSKTKSVTTKGSDNMMKPSMNRKPVSSKASTKTVSRKKAGRMQDRFAKKEQNMMKGGMVNMKALKAENKKRRSMPRGY
jgi:hypothetical protein